MAGQKPQTQTIANLPQSSDVWFDLYSCSDCSVVQRQSTTEEWRVSSEIQSVMFTWKTEKNLFTVTIIQT